MAPFILLACMHRAPVASNHLDTGASSDADAAAHALLAANLDCGLTPSMALDADGLVAVISFTVASTWNWVLTDSNILAATSNFTQGNPDQGCFTRGDSDFSATCEDIEGWTITGSMAWAWGDWQSGSWTDSGACSDLVLDDPIGDWQFTADGRWQVDHAEGSLHIDIDRRWTNSGILGGAIGEFSLIAAGDYAMGGVYSGALTARGSDLPGGSACFAFALSDDAAWSAVQGKRLWERKQFTNASGEACSTYYRDGVEVSTDCG